MARQRIVIAIGAGKHDDTELHEVNCT
jgi:hypothetical protein